MPKAQTRACTVCTHTCGSTPRAEAFDLCVATMRRSKRQAPGEAWGTVQTSRNASPPGAPSMKTSFTLLLNPLYHTRCLCIPCYFGLLMGHRNIRLSHRSSVEQGDA
eukprot:4690749-Amphidinium_carterae.1